MEAIPLLARETPLQRRPSEVPHPNFVNTRLARDLHSELSDFAASHGMSLTVALKHAVASFFNSAAPKRRSSRR